MRALVCVGGGLGDVVMATPTVQAVVALGYVCDILIKPDIAVASSLFKGWKDVRKVYTSKKPPPGEIYDAVVRTWWHRDFILDCGPEYVPGRQNIRKAHESEACLASARALGYTGPVPEPYVSVPRSCRFQLSRPYIAICPGFSSKQGRAFWARKSWPHWGDFMRAHLDKQFVILGSAKDAAGKYSKIVGPNVTNMVGKTQLEDAIFILNQAEYVVAIDNGLAHIASAIDKFTFALFGATSEIKNRPLGRRSIVITADVDCRPCQMTPAWHKCKDFRCMSKITPDHVWAEIAGEGL